ncbi:MAG TPA: prenyltransferase/squalene oxidase repeat-containing protein [Bryobacterales bacterium]|nr:prenyltransferase/squalene oxidase repeat-containing protein [Bryobacterales bacterium]
MRTFLVFSGLSLSLGLAWQQAAVAQNASGAETAALDYLSQQVPLWKTGNGCYSCHNNGDGARVLYAAQRLGHKPAPLQDTTDWLSRPQDWDENRGAPEFSDKKLARIQFAAALEAAVEAGLAPRQALVTAARSLLPHQESDGSWKIDESGLAGSPITYGAALATYAARRVLKSAGDPTLDEAIDRASLWFERTAPKNVLDASATVLALSDASPRSGIAQRRGESVALISAAQNGDGGWGPYLNSPSEPFDTALALLALNALPASQDERIRRGRNFLTETQLPAGGWPETTRPSGSQSYAQHISTTAWATLALLETSK